MSSYKYEEVGRYLQLFPPGLIKQYLWIFTIMIDIIGIPTALLGAAKEITSIILLPIIIICNIWAFLLMVNTEKKQKQYILYIGIFSLFMSVIFLIASYKMVNLAVNNLSSFTLIVIISFYLLILIANMINVLHMLKQGYYSFKKQSKAFNKGTAIIVAMSSLGAVSGRLLIRMVDEQTGAVILSLCLLFLAFMIGLGTHNIYKYNLLKKFKI